LTVRPLVLFMLAFGAGLLAAASATWLIWIGVVVLAGMCGMLLSTRRAVWLPYALYTAVGLVGSLDYGFHARIAANDVSSVTPCTITLTGVVESDVEIIQSDPDSGPSTVRVILRATRAELPPSLANPQGRTTPVSGNVELRLRLRSGFQDTSVSQNSPHYGDTISVRGQLELPAGPRNPGGFDYRTYLAHNGIHATLFAVRPEDWHIISESGENGNPFLTLAYALRRAVLRHARIGFTPERGAVLSGILLGDRTNLPADLREDFERTGTTHILATAGLHVGLVMALLIGLFRTLRLSLRPALVCTLLCLALYIPMTGERVAMTRAAIMALVYLGGMLLEREPYLPNTLSLAALILLVGNPLSLFDAGFQLSFGIVITVAMLSPLMQRLRKAAPEEALPAGRIRDIGKFLLDIFCIALAAQIGALPLVAYYFHGIPVVGIVANLLIVPIVLPIIALGFLATALAIVTPILAAPLDKALDYLLAYIVTMTHFFSSPDWAMVPIGEFSPILVFAAYTVLWGGAWYLYRQKDKNQAGAD
jgi:ComEC/Rec2-related protein